MKKYDEINLDSVESQRTERGDDYHGETYDPRRGAAVAHLPGDMLPCEGIAMSTGAHSRDCVCAGRGTMPIRRAPADEILPTDDSLSALELALADHAAERAESVDPFWGDSVTRIMQHELPAGSRSGGGGGKRRARKPVMRRSGGERPPSRWEAGRSELTGRGVNSTEVDHAKAAIAELEAQAAALRSQAAALRAETTAKTKASCGRKPRWKDCGTRDQRMNLTLAPETLSLVIGANSDMASEFRFACAE